MPPTYEELLETIKKKDDMIEELEKRHGEEIRALKERLEKVEKELHKYKNENNPSSANKHLKRNTQGLHAKGGKRGAPFGHKGTTRRQQPEAFNEVDVNECPNCHGDNLEDVAVLKRVTDEIPVPVKPICAETKIHKKKCRDCGSIFVPPQNTVPLEGKFGVNFMVMILMLKFTLRGVLQKVASFVEYGFSFAITAASVNAIVKRAANAATKEYEELKNRIKNSTKVHVDETSFSVLGMKFWLWVFRTDTDILFVMRYSRGQDVLKEILGGDYSGKLICDCLPVYNFLVRAIIQRCWAHLLRKSKVLITVPGKHFHQKLHGMFEEINRFNGSNPTQAQRLEKYEQMTQELTETMRYYDRYPEITPVINYIDNHLEQWLNCVKFSDIEPTNNLAEQAIRECVLVRKIIGAFRSLDGAAYYERLASLFATWQLRGADVQVELKRMLTSNLCFC